LFPQNLIEDMLTFYFAFILFKAFRRAEIDRFPVDLRPAGIANGNVGVADGIFHKVLTGCRGFDLGRTGFPPHPRKAFPEKFEQNINNDDADYKPEYHFSTFIFYS